MTLNTEGSITLVGPSVVTAEGGMCGTYLRTTSDAGEAFLMVKAPDLEPVVITFNVE